MFIIDKIFNLKIDTKNKNISEITGFKQFDNNSILNIILLQNNLALDLTNCTVRLNFKREDDRVLLYMASIVSAREGKLSIKLSPEVLKCTGNIEADISVFDSNLLKITSTTFNMKVDKAIYNNDTYFTDKDLDLMQQEYIKERERESNENIRKSNETTRITKENQRNSNENTRISNEEARKKAENTRVDEWNNVKKDASNIKNTLNATIDTANKSNSSLKNTIASGDKLKAELNINSYVKNKDYQQFKKESTAQYEDLTKKTNYYIKEYSGNTLKTLHYRFMSYENNSMISIMTALGYLDCGYLDCIFDLKLYVHFREGKRCKISTTSVMLPYNFKSNFNIFYKIDNKKGFLDLYIKASSNWSNLTIKTEELLNSYKETTIRGEEVDTIPGDVIKVEVGDEKK